MSPKEILEKASHDIESSLSQIEFVFHQKNISSSDAKDLEKIFMTAVNRIRLSNGALRDICLSGESNEKVG